MTPKDKVRAWCNRVLEMSEKATKGPWELERVNIGSQHPIAIKILGFDSVRFPDEIDTELAALSRNSAPLMAKLILAGLDQCNRCRGRGEFESATFRGTWVKCELCTARYAEFCAELETMGLMEKE